MVKTNLGSSKSIRRPRSDTDPIPTRTRTQREKPFPVKAGSERMSPTKGLPPTPPSESEGYGLQRSRSHSQPAVNRAQPGTARSSGSSDYTPPARPRLATVRDDDFDEDQRYETDMRRARSMNVRGRSGDSRQVERQLSRREPLRGRRQDEIDEVYDIYDYYDEDKPMRANTTRRPLQRGLSRSRASSSSRGRRDMDETYSDEDDEFEMVTPKRTEISKVSPSVRHP
jgi:hypothetical protein